MAAISGRRYVEVAPGEFAPEVVLSAGAGTTDKIASAIASVAAGTAFVTVLAVTPAAKAKVLGYSADLAGILAVNYRLRLITGTDAAPTVLHEETIATTGNAWMPVRVDVEAGVRIAVQVVHAEVGAQDARATINWQED
jgi:hypothetical protein